MLTSRMRSSLKARFVGLGSSSSWTGDSAGASVIARSSSEGGGGSRLEGMSEEAVWAAALDENSSILISVSEAPAGTEICYRDAESADCGLRYQA